MRILSLNNRCKKSLKNINKNLNARPLPTPSGDKMTAAIDKEIVIFQGIRLPDLAAVAY